MAPKNLLVVMLEGGSPSRLQQAVARRGDGSPNVHVVAPMQVGPLEWLATDEESARAKAGVRALEAEWLLTTEAEVDGETGDLDPVLAVEDALRKFPADEIMVVGGAEDGGVEAALRRFGLPVTRVGEPPPPGRRSLLREAARGLAAGRSKATPFVFFAAVNLFLLALAALITLVVLFILWLS